MPSTQTQIQPWSPSEPEVMELSGRINDVTAPGIEEDARLCIESGARRMILDCRDVVSITGAGLRSMLALARAMQATGGRFAVCELQPQVREMFTAVGLETIVPVYADQVEAIAAFAG